MFMDRPLQDRRPLGPFITSGSTAKIRYKLKYVTEQGATETKQSLERSVKDEVSDDVPVSNVNVMTGSADFIMEVGMDIEKKVLSDSDEAMIQRAVGRTLIEGGVEDVTIDEVKRVAVQR